MTFKELKALRRKQLRLEKKEIEHILSLITDFGDVQILHEHRGQKIIFTAWRGDNPIYYPCDKKSVVTHRGTVLAHGEKYFQDNKNNFEWLADETKSIRDI